MLINIYSSWNLYLVVILLSAHGCDQYLLFINVISISDLWPLYLVYFTKKNIVFESIKKYSEKQTLGVF